MTWTHQPQDCESCRHSERRDVTGLDEQGGQVTVPAILCVHPRQMRKPYPVSAGVVRDFACKGNWWARADVAAARVQAAQRHGKGGSVRGVIQASGKPRKPGTDQ